MNTVPVFLLCNNILILAFQRDVCMGIFFFTLIVTDTPSADYDGAPMMRLRRSDDGMTQEHKDRDED